LPSGFRPIAGNTPEAERLRWRAVSLTLDRGDRDAWLKLLDRIDLGQAASDVGRSLHQQLGLLTGVHQEADEEAWCNIEPLETLRGPDVESAIEALAAAREAMPDSRFVKAHARDLRHARGRDWEAFLTNGLAGKVARGEETYYKKPIPVEPYARLIEHAQAVVVNKRLAGGAALHELLERYAQAWEQVSAEAGVVLFEDVPFRLARSAELVGLGSGRNAGLFERLDARVRHVLIDEFQDTSPSQWAVLRPIAEEICLGEPEAPDDPADRSGRSFLVVGDAKQAIYGWRGGCAEVFDAALDQLHLHDQQETLATSYRSSPVVLEAVNRLFARIDEAPPLTTNGLTAPAGAWARRFEPHKAQHQHLQGHVAIHVTEPQPDDDATDAAGPSEPGDDDGPGAAPSSHVSQAAQLVADLAAKRPGLSIGVLTRRNKTVGAMQTALRALGVDSAGPGGLTVGGDPAAGVALSALRFADHPGDTASAWRVRCSPLREACGLAEYRQPGEPGEAARLAKAAQRLRKQAMDEGLGPMLTRWGRLLAPHADAAGGAALARLVSLGDEVDAAGRAIRLRAFADQAEQTRLDDPSPAGVRAMTVHQSKGLEFDAVVLPELRGGKAMGSVNSDGVWRLRPDPMSPPNAVLLPMGEKLRDAVAGRAPWFERAHEQESAARALDDLSQLYVAVTRARHALHLVLEPVSHGAKGPSAKGTTNATAESLVRWAFDLGDRLEDTGLVYEGGDAGWRPPSQETEPVEVEADPPTPAEALGFDERTTPRRAMRSVAPSSVGHGRAASSGWRAPRLDSAEAEAAHSATDLGTAVHAMFEAVGFLDDPDGLPTTDARRAGLEAEGLPGLFEQADALFEAALQHAEVRQALSRSSPADALHHEAPFSILREGQVLTGRIDRLVDHGDGTATVLDFKTDRLEADADLADWAQGYHAQLEAYRHAAAGLLGIDESHVRCGLLAVRLGRVVWLEA
ncbi:MAG: UvrD-helicase domain-containing protein, partial [Planctomycetota bacterium]